MYLHKASIMEKKNKVFLVYFGLLNQEIISNLIENLEAKVSDKKLNITILNNMITTFIELTQNIIKYSNIKKGFVYIGKNDLNYFIHTRNIISKSDKDKVQPKLEKILLLNKEEIQKEYQRLRKNAKNAHAKGAGIGFYEIAKRSDNIEFSFKEINPDKYYFDFIANIKIKK